jgi:hypothetical protein
MQGVMAPTKTSIFSFQSARLPTASALPLKKGTSARPAGSSRINYTGRQCARKQGAMSLPGTRLPKPKPGLCPQPAEADLGP